MERWRNGTGARSEIRVVVSLSAQTIISTGRRLSSKWSGSVHASCLEGRLPGVNLPACDFGGPSRAECAGNIGFPGLRISDNATTALFEGRDRHRRKKCNSQRNWQYNLTRDAARSSTQDQKEAAGCILNRSRESGTEIPERACGPCAHSGGIMRPFVVVTWAVLSLAVGSLAAQPADEQAQKTNNIRKFIDLTG